MPQVSGNIYSQARGMPWVQSANESQSSVRLLRKLRGKSRPSQYAVDDRMHDYHEKLDASDHVRQSDSDVTGNKNVPVYLPAQKPVEDTDDSTSSLLVSAPDSQAWVPPNIILTPPSNPSSPLVSTIPQVSALLRVHFILERIQHVSIL
ncbi:hypothetical protein FISHEDRAFT_55759 [Fistulina hepatica ATCC 64428]|uniref:Uncharacterized protein n=1 Tax=Fistulina hepatica ATCC 64428 TaxID=1128425 RepID=A0A0D7APT1_9AGAR|nr:hypothetical protein FISHEDRAFT_55759 [Fistulina hepatica ATCC 64428]